MNNKKGAGRPPKNGIAKQTKEELAELAKVYYAKNRERICEYNKRYWQEHKDDPEFKAKRAAYSKRAWRDPEIHERRKQYNTEYMRRKREQKKREVLQEQRERSSKGNGGPTDVQ